jgi:hypothetical protein
VRDFDNPTPGLLLGVTLEFTCLLPSPFDVGNVAVFFDDFQGRRSGAIRVGTQVIVAPVRGIGSLKHDGIKHRFQLRDFMPVGSCHDERQQDAISVHQQMALDLIFSPIRRLGSDTLLCRWRFHHHPSTLCHRQAMLPRYRISALWIMLFCGETAK